MITGTNAEHVYNEPVDIFNGYEVFLTYWHRPPDDTRHVIYWTAKAHSDGYHCCSAISPRQAVQNAKRYDKRRQRG